MGLKHEMTVKFFDSCFTKFVEGIKPFVCVLISFIVGLGLLLSTPEQSEANTSNCGRHLGAALSENIEERGGFKVISNEANLYMALPYIREAKGAGIGVGSDQMLDFAVNSKLSQVYIIDISKVYQLDLTDRVCQFKLEGRGYGIIEPARGIYLLGLTP